MKTSIKWGLERIAKEYNPNRDLDPSAPRVNWVEKSLLDAIIDLQSQIDELKENLDKVQ
jgi:hypothetical protein